MIRTSGRRWLGAAVGAAALLAGSWAAGPRVMRALGLERYFAVAEVRVVGGRHVTAAEVRRWLAVSPGANVWRLDLAALEARLERHPWIARARVRRRLPDRLEVAIREREPRAIVFLDDVYYADGRGEVFGPLGQEDPRDFPVITGLAEVRDRGLRGRRLRRALGLLRRARADGALGPVSEVRLGPRGGAVVFLSRRPVMVVLGRGSWGEKLVRAARVLEDWPLGAGPLRIDLRFHNQVVVAFGAGRRAARRGVGRHAVQG